jgi:hypothetical protein
VDLVPEPPAAPSGERGPNGPEPTVRAALHSLTRQSERDPATGRWTAGNLGRLVTFEESTQFWAAVAPAKAELVSRVASDLAADATTPTTLLGLIEAYAEARLFRTAMFLRLTDLGGPITVKGKARALYKAYLAASERETKLAQLIGLERRTKLVDPLDAVRAAVHEASHIQEGRDEG